MDKPIRPAAVAMVLGGTLSAQLGSAFATKLFDYVGPAGGVLLRTAFAAAILLAVWRPTFFRGRTKHDVLLAVALGTVLAGMNLSFYEAIDRIPLGIAVTLEFIGPLGVAIFTSPNFRSAIWGLIAGVGVVLLSGGLGGGEIEAAGVAFALFAGVCWGSYILIAARVGQAFTGGDGLAIAMTVSMVALAPFGIAVGGAELLSPHVLVLGLGVGIATSVIPFSLEMEALRRLPERIVGVLMSLEPVVAAVAGLIVLNQALSGVEVFAIGLVVIASTGALLTASAGTPAPTDH